MINDRLKSFSNDFGTFSLSLPKLQSTPIFQKLIEDQTAETLNLTPEKVDRVLKTLSIRYKRVPYLILLAKVNHEYQVIRACASNMQVITRFEMTMSCGGSMTEESIMLLWQGGNRLIVNQEVFLVTGGGEEAWEYKSIMKFGEQEVTDSITIEKDYILIGY